jgi:hypothetical protein
MTSLAEYAGLPLAVLASVVLLSGCNDSSKSSASQANTGDAKPASDIYQKECQAMQPIFSDPKTPASAKDPEKLITAFKSGPEWSLLSKQQQDDAVAGIRKAATGSCN